MQQTHELGGLARRLMLIGSLKSAQNSPILPLELRMTELTANAIRTASVLPKTVAFSAF